MSYVVIPHLVLLAPGQVLPPQAVGITQFTQHASFQGGLRESQERLSAQPDFELHLSTSEWEHCRREWRTCLSVEECGDGLAISVHTPHSCLGNPMLASMWEKTSHPYDSTHLWPQPPVSTGDPAPLYDLFMAPIISLCFVNSFSCFEVHSKDVLLDDAQPYNSPFRADLEQKGCPTLMTAYITLLCISVFFSREEASWRQCLLHS